MAFLIRSAGRPRWRAARRWIAILGLALAAVRGDAADSAPPSGEYQVKAVFLFNFAQFVEWPARSFAGPTSPLVIGLLGSDPFGSYLDDLVKDEKIGEHPLRIRRCRDLDDVAGCQILFVSRSESAQLDRILQRLHKDSILTISDADAFTRAGGMVRFVMESGKVRLRINVDEAKSSGLTISSKILRPSTIVTTGKD